MRFSLELATAALARALSLTMVRSARTKHAFPERGPPHPAASIG
jgi:hypothetical protein